jgi:hypothetical protein
MAADSTVNGRSPSVTTRRACARAAWCDKSTCWGPISGSGPSTGWPGRARWCRVQPLAGQRRRGQAFKAETPPSARQRTMAPVARDWARPDSSSAASRAPSRSSTVCPLSRMARKLTPAVASAMMLMTTSSSSSVKPPAGRCGLVESFKAGSRTGTGAAAGQRKVMRGHATHGGGCAEQWRHCQLPMSASLPSPPDCPSAPNDITSISPLMPGLRYW